MEASRATPPAAEAGFTEAHHAEFMERGFIQLGQLLPPPELQDISERLDALMMGTVVQSGVTFQLDPGGAYTRSDMGPHRGPSLQYRRMEGLEHDPLLSGFSEHPLIIQIHERYYGDSVRMRRPIFMNKPAGRSTALPWHQDVPTGPRSLQPGTPIVNIWTAIDACDESNGCMSMVPGSVSAAVFLFAFPNPSVPLARTDRRVCRLVTQHKHGILNAGSFTSEANVARYCTADAVVPVPVKAGHSVMFNNCTLHSSGVNSTADRNRRAIVIRPVFDMTR